MELTFTKWIKKQAKRNGSIGDIAKDIKLDHSWPRKGSSKQVYLNHLRYEHDASERALTAYEKAYAAWEILASSQNTRLRVSNFYSNLKCKELPDR